jgi:hypothetical protein
MSPPKAGGIFYSRGFKEEVLAPVAIRSNLSGTIIIRLVK